MHGVVMNKDPLLLDRPELINAIKQALAIYPRLLMTAPPGSGKTAIIQLLNRDLLRNNRNLRVLYWAVPPLGDGTPYQARLVQQARCRLLHYGVSLNDERSLNNLELIDRFDYVFVDDAQRLFGNIDGKTLFNQLVEHIHAATYDESTFTEPANQSDKRPTKIVFSASYSLEAIQVDSPDITSRVSDRITFVSYHIDFICSVSHICVSCHHVVVLEGFQSFERETGCLRQALYRPSGICTPSRMDAYLG